MLDVFGAVLIKGYAPSDIIMIRLKYKHQNPCVFTKVNARLFESKKKYFMRRFGTVSTDMPLCLVKRNQRLRCIMALMLLLTGLPAMTACAQQKTPETPVSDTAAKDSLPADDIMIPDTFSDEPDIIHAITTQDIPQSQTKSEQMKSAEDSVMDIISEYDRSVAVAVLPLDGSLGFSINGDKSFVSASMIKLLILAEYLDETDNGNLDSDSLYTRNSNDVVGGTGVIQSEAPGTTYSYDELAKYMIIYSDNTATNVLIDLMDMNSVNEKARELGLNAAGLQRKMMDFNSGTENHISANDAALIFSKIATHTLASETSCKKAESYLLQQVDSEGLAQGLPAGIDFGHKTGSLGSIRHDGGIVYSANPYVIVVLTEIGAPAANNIMKAISNTVYKCLNC